MGEDSVFGWDLEYGDWRPESERDKETPSIGLYVPDVGNVLYEGTDEAAQEFQKETEDYIKASTEADEVYIRYIDPDVGAAGVGLGVLVSFLEMGAAAITWAGAAMWLAPRIKDALASIKSRFHDTVYLSRDALKLLVVHDICDHEDTLPESLDVKDVQCVTHACTPTEPRLELQEMYAVHTVVVRAIIDRWPHYAWTYFITADGLVISEGGSQVPNPSGPRWEEIDIDGRKLKGLGQ